MSSLAYAHRLAQGNGTILFEVASQKLFTMSSYTAGTFCFAAAAINYQYNVINAPPGVPQAIPIVFTIAAVMFSAFGTSYFLKPAHVIRSIRVLPVGASSKSSKGPQSKVYLEILATRTFTIPGLGLRRIVVEPHGITVKNRLYMPKIEPTAMQRYQMQLDDERRKKEEREYTMNNLMTTPFRHAWWAISTIFFSLRRGITGEGFATLGIRGIKYKLDIKNGYALDGGRALDKLLKLEEEPHD